MPRGTLPIHGLSARRWRGAAAQFGVIAAVATAVLVWSWGKWPDPLVDFGRELYVPWRISEGDALYRDIAWFNGPLSPHLNAISFLIFGEGLRTLVIANIVVAMLILVLLYTIMSEIAGRLSAFVGSLLFLLVFFAGQFLEIGNYNYIAPYSHEMTHGLALSLGAIWASMRFARIGRLNWLISAGVLVGLVFLTKAEFFIAAAPAVAISVVMLWAGTHASDSDSSRPGVIKALLILTTAAVAPAVISWTLLLPLLGPAGALTATLGNWVYLLDPRLHALEFYQRGYGLTDPYHHLIESAKMLGWYVAVIGPGLVLAIATPRRWTWQVIASCTAAWVTVYILWFFPTRYAWLEVGRPLAVTTLIAVFACGTVAWRRRRAADSPGGRRAALAVCWCVFSLLLLLKMFLHVRAYHYGFVLAMPAALTLVMALLDWIPRWLENRGGRALIFRAVALAAIAVMIARFVGFSDDQFRQKIHRVGSGPDSFLAGARGLAVQSITAELMFELEDRPPDAAALAVLPEGVMINYLLRRRNPTPYISLMPPEVIMFGEETIVESYRENPPHYIIRLSRSTGEYGVEIGRDYGVSLFDWMAAEYEPLRRLRSGAITGDLLRRRGGPATRTSVNAVP